MVFVAEVVTCVGFHACRIACKDRADLPDGLYWLRVQAKEGGVYPTSSLRYVVSHCFHCEEPPGVGLTFHGAGVQSRARYLARPAAPAR